ncbi:acyltransferase [Peribacillus frigoritolerans]|uniref:acyltransferase family protein n=1 Tax=Peribacillus frigoritolerans TaxID=450367 RepID=UPI003ED1313A
MKTMGRLKELDSIRGIAALAVVIYHYTTRYEELFEHNKSSYLEINYGNLGVNLFFIISGFVIFMTITKTNSVIDFFQKRAIRLYPAYIIAVVLTFLSVKMYGLEGREVSLPDALFNLTMFQGFVPSVSHVDGAYWSLSIELTFYLLIGFIFFLGLTKKIYLMSILWLTSSIIFQVLSLISNQNTILNALTYYSISDYSHLFIAGIMFYLIKDNPELKYYLLLVSCLIYQFIFNDITHSIIITMFFVIFFALIKGKLSLLNIRPLTFLGAISYSLYLVHQNIGYILINFMEKHGLIHEIYLLIPIGVSISLATMLTYYVENPVIKFFKNRIKKEKIKQDKLSLPSC